jgi:3-methylcrotonyl-CoA carboxylase alpha subunit
MIAKIIAHGDDRRAVAAQLAETCETRVKCWPVRTNAAFLANLLGDPDFQDGNVDTGLIQREIQDLLPPDKPSDLALQSVALLVMDRAAGGRAENIRQTYIERPNSPWSWLGGFRANAPAAGTTLRLTEGQQRYDVEFQEIDVDSALWVSRVPEGYLIVEDGTTFVLSEFRESGVDAGAAGDGTMISPMPGRIISVDVRQGDTVAKGQKLVTLEAMKMEHSLTAPFDGIVAELNAVEGAQVTEGTLLVRIEKGDRE